MHATPDATAKAGEQSEGSKSGQVKPSSCGSKKKKNQGTHSLSHSWHWSGIEDAIEIASSHSSRMLEITRLHDLWPSNAKNNSKASRDV